MFENLYNLLLNFAGRIESGLVLGVMDLDLGIEKKIKPNIEPVIYNIQRIKYDINPIWRGKK